MLLAIEKLMKFTDINTIGATEKLFMDDDFKLHL